jgi:predicted glycosyltransferase
MLPLVIREKPILALSHGSRTQLLVASFLGIRSLEIIDYEHTRTLPFSHPDWMVIPEVLAGGDVNQDRNRILEYPGIKEDIYVPRFRPDASLRGALNVKESDIVVTIRPPATDAHYFVPESQELFVATMNHLAGRNVRMIVLPRNEKQRAFIRKSWPALLEKRTIIIPDKVLDGLNLLWHSDLVISGGGTMNREAAALGVPVYSIFRGKIGAVDRYLAQTGRLVLLEKEDDLRSRLLLKKREIPDRPLQANTAALEALVRTITAVANTADEKQILTAVRESGLREKSR